MSGNEPPASPSTTGETPKPKVKKQWKSPALRMMGIPRFSLPSRNWLIFWTVVAGLGGGIAYDKYEQKQIRAKWMKHVEHLSQEAYPNDRIPRKMSIFIAPPPDNFLDVSMKYFKKYVKPVLNAAAVDYEVYSENRQGDIRASVAEKIRELRRERSGIESKSDQDSGNDSKKDMLSSFKKLTSGGSKSEGDEEVLVKRLDLYKVRDVLGFYYFNDTIYPHRDDELDPEKAGGVICIGRGAFKEYMAGVHEGLLGPLEAPEPPVSEVEKVSEITNETAEKTDEETGEKKEETNPVPKPFIRPEQYADAELAPELDTSRQVLNNKNVPVLFEQPVYVFALPTIVGFANTPRKIYRFFNQRSEAEDFCRRTAQLVDNKSRPFEYKDQFMAKEEESEWPKKWVQKGKDKGSEWVQELVVDDRIAQRFRVFEVDEK
jgi:import inner membrane translocase subunit TIM54